LTHSWFRKVPRTIEWPARPRLFSTFLSRFRVKTIPFKFTVTRLAQKRLAKMAGGCLIEESVKISDQKKQ
jgi:hypothetical protein